MLIKITELLKVDELLEIRNHPDEIQIILCDVSGRAVCNSHTFKVWELEEFKGDQEVFTKELINRLRLGIKRTKQQRNES